MPDLRKVHCFRDYAVAGVNWRPTRFVDEVPSSRVCGLCCMIPKRILVLPCGHVLGQSCLTGSSPGGRCPLDQYPFDEAECCAVDFPMGKAKALKERELTTYADTRAIEYSLVKQKPPCGLGVLGTKMKQRTKVHCWNDAHGCQYKGAVEDMLGHYENECTFHTVECTRCGEEILHRDLSSHYTAGCSAPVSSARTENPSPEPAALTLQEVSAALVELKTLVRDQMLPAVQSQMNELTEQARSQEFRMAEITREVGASQQNLSAEVVQGAATISTAMPERVRSKRNPAEEATTSSPFSCSETAGTHRKLDYFTHLPAGVLEKMRKLSSGDYPQYAVTGHGPMNVICHLRLLYEESSKHGGTWREMRQSFAYRLAIENIHGGMLSQGDNTNISKITLLHTRDAYSRVEVFQDVHFLYLHIEFNGMLEGSPCKMPLLDVTAHTEQYYSDEPYSFQVPCYSKHDENSLVHFHRTFRITHDTLKSNDYFLSGTLLFDVKFSPA